MLGRLEHGAVAAEDRRERLPRDVRERRVERDQERGDADGAPRASSTVRCGIDAVVVRPYEAPPLARDEEPHLDRRVGLAARELERLAGLRGDELARLLAPLAQQLGDRANDVAPLDGRPRGPLRLRGAGGLDGGGGVVGARPRDTGRAAPRPPAASCRATSRWRPAAPRLRRGSAPPRGSPGRPAPVDDEVRARDVRRRVGREEHHRADRLRHVHQPAERRARRERLDERARLAVLDAVRGERVDADARCGPSRSRGSA